MLFNFLPFLPITRQIIFHPYRGLSTIFFNIIKPVSYQTTTVWTRKNSLCVKFPNGSDGFKQNIHSRVLFVRNKKYI